MVGGQWMLKLDSHSLIALVHFDCPRFIIIPVDVIKCWIRAHYIQIWICISPIIIIKNRQWKWVEYALSIEWLPYTWAPMWIACKQSFASNANEENTPINYEYVMCAHNKNLIGDHKRMKWLGKKSVGYHFAPTTPTRSKGKPFKLEQNQKRTDKK